MLRFQASETPSIMDLPNLRKQPTYATLLSVLQALEVHPNSWNKTPSDERSSVNDETVVQRFLMSVIASDLEWLPESTDVGGKLLTALEQKEILFDLASRRVAERCGRSGKCPFEPSPVLGAKFHSFLSSGRERPS
jgi:hypothetical protein